MRLSRVLAGLLAGGLVCGLAACNGPRKDEANGSSAPIVENVGNVPAAPNEAAANETAPTPSAAANDLTLDGLGAVRIGTTVRELKASGLKVKTDANPAPGSDCSYLQVPSLPKVFVMLDKQTVVRIDVASPAYATIGGVAVGMSEADALQRLGPAAVVQPHPYTGPEGHYLLLHAKGAPRGLIVETDGKTVERYRTGRWAEVQWIEGCS